MLYSFNNLGPLTDECLVQNSNIGKQGIYM